MEVADTGCASCTATSRWWTALALILAAPSLLCYTPTRLPVGEAGHTIVWLGCRCTTNLSSTSLAVHLAAPRLLADGPAGLPVCKAICAIVWVCRCHWSHWHHWHHWSHRHWWRRTSHVVHVAAPSLLATIPLADGANCAVVRVAT